MVNKKEHEMTEKVTSNRSVVGPGLFLAVGLTLAGSPAAADGPVFLRGDANGDGKISVSDFEAIFKWTMDFAHRIDDGIPWNALPPHPYIPCLDAADANDDGVPDFTDAVVVLNTLFLIDPAHDPYGVIQSPFPVPGPDLTPDWGADSDVFGNDLGCESYQPVPPASTDDIVRLGEVEAHPGEAVGPHYMTLRGGPRLQLVVAYDPTIRSISSMKGHSFRLHRHGVRRALYPLPSTTHQPNLDQTYPTRGSLVTVGIHIGADYIPAGAGLVEVRSTFRPTRRRGRRSRSASPADPMDGASSRRSTSRAELTHDGAGLLVGVLPQRVDGRVSIVDDLTVFGAAMPTATAASISDPILSSITSHRRRRSIALARRRYRTTAWRSRSPCGGVLESLFSASRASRPLSVGREGLTPTTCRVTCKSARPPGQSRRRVRMSRPAFRAACRVRPFHAEGVHHLLRVSAGLPEEPGM